MSVLLTGPVMITRPVANIKSVLGVEPGPKCPPRAVIGRLQSRGPTYRSLKY